MGGFEVIVRPVVFPSIRPQPSRALPPEDDPEQGIATISGSGGRVIDLTYSYTVSKSRSPHHTEQARASDEFKIYQEEDDGSINEDNWVKLRRARHTLLRDTTGEEYETHYMPQKPARNVELIRTDVVDYKGDT